MLRNTQTLPSLHEVLPELFARSSKPDALSRKHEGGRVHREFMPGFTQPRALGKTNDVHMRASEGMTHSTTCPHYDTQGISRNQHPPPTDHYAKDSKRMLPKIHLPPLLTENLRQPEPAQAASPPSDRLYPQTSVAPVQGRDDDKKHLCPYCPKRFNRPSSLSIHINTHTGARPFECPKCGRQFSVNSNMRRHYRNHESSDIHYGLPPYTLATASYGHTAGHPPYSSPYSYAPLRPPSHSPESQYSYGRNSDSEETLAPGTLSRGAAHHEQDLEQSLSRCRLDSQSPRSVPRSAVYSNGPRARSMSYAGSQAGMISTALRPATYDNKSTKAHI